MDDPKSKFWVWGYFTMGMSYCCWLVELRKKIHFSNSKISYIGVFWPLTCWIGLSCLKLLKMGLCYFAVDLLNWENHFQPTQKFPTWVCFLPLTCWIGLSCLKFLNVGVCHFVVDLLNWEETLLTNSKISNRGIFLFVDLLNWAILLKTSSCGGMSFCCWIVELRKNLLNQLKNFIYSCLFWPLTCWFVLSCLKFLNMGVCHFAVDLLNWRKSISPTQKFPIQVFFCPLNCWIGLSCLKMTNVEVYNFAVDLLNWEKIIFTNSKISYIGDFSAVDLLNWPFLPKIFECKGVLFCCWLVELKKIVFTNSKISYIGVFWPLTCWIGLFCR